MNEEQQRKLKLAKTKKNNGQFLEVVFDKKEMAALHDRLSQTQEAVATLLDAKASEVPIANDQLVEANNNLVKVIAGLETYAEVIKDSDKSEHLVNEIKKAIAGIPVPKEAKEYKPTEIPKWLQDSTKIDKLSSDLVSIGAQIQGSLSELKSSQKPEEFLPFRRVKKVGNRLLFDDETWGGSFGGGGSGGGGSSIPLVNGSVSVVNPDGTNIGGGGGGGATTIADGADIALGAQADAVASDDTGAFSLIALFKRLLDKLSTGIGLPTGAATSNNQDTSNTWLEGINSNLLDIDGKIMAANTNNVTITSTVAPADLVSPGSIGAINEHVNLAGLNGASSVSVLVSGTYTGVLTTQVSVDNDTWTTLVNVVDVATGIVSSTIPDGAQSTYLINIPSIYAFRVIALGEVTGTAAVTIRGGQGANAGTPAIALVAPLATALNTYAVRITTNTTTTPISSTAYISSITITTEVGGTTSTVTIKDKQGTPQVLVNGLTTTAASLSPTVINFQTPVKMTSGIDIVTAGAVAGTVDVWINYYA